MPFRWWTRVALWGALVTTLIGCGGVPTRTAEPATTGGALEARARALEPRLDELEARMDRGAIVAAVAALPPVADAELAPVRRYLEARLRLAVAIVGRFERDHEIAREPEADRAANLDRAFHCLKVILEAGVGESEHYRVYSDLHAMRIDTLLDGMRWGSGLLAALEEADRLDPQNRWVPLSRGKRRLFAPAGLGRDLARAAAHFQRAATLDPTWAAPHLFLAEVALARGEDDRAREELEAALRLRPDHRFARRLLTELEKKSASRSSGRALRATQSAAKRRTRRKVAPSLTPVTTSRGILA